MPGQNPVALVRGYDNWCAVAAFFDGDGCVRVNPKKDTIGISLEFADNWRPQLEQIMVFIGSQGVTMGKLRKMKGGAYDFVIVSQSGVVSVARAMLATSCCFKKRLELQGVLRYFANEITGNEFVQLINYSVSSGNRTGKIRNVNIPFLHSEGSIQRYFRLAASRQVLTGEQKEQILIGRRVRGMTLNELARQYGVSITTIARVVGNRKGR